MCVSLPSITAHPHAGPFTARPPQLLHPHVPSRYTRCFSVTLQVDVRTCDFLVDFESTATTVLEPNFGQSADWEVRQ